MKIVFPIPLLYKITGVFSVDDQQDTRDERSELPPWKVEPQAAALVQRLVSYLKRELPAAERLATDLLQRTGTRLIDWVDRVAISESETFGDEPIVERLRDTGFVVTDPAYPTVLRNPGGIFPAIESVSGPMRLEIKVENVADFLIAHQLDGIETHGQPLASVRRARISEGERAELWIVERHGDRESIASEIDLTDTANIVRHREAFLLRPRGENSFANAGQLIARAVDDLGVDRSCDLFFSAERQYWQSRNRAARIQKTRQDALGMGWANHDHHTYRSSRECFADLIGILKQLGFICRERFYAGEQAGWGAQVLEQETCGIVIFADVDILPGEVEGDFAETGLPATKQLGTVGLWCKLHGEAFLKAGMHHLECQFDFDAARQQLQELGIESMAPFTEMPHLKQAFTKPEIWDVAPERIEGALKAGWIDDDQAEKFREDGAVGSHLEILERNDGYKGFNQTGISHIIKETDPRVQQG